MFQLKKSIAFKIIFALIITVSCVSTTQAKLGMAYVKNENKIGKWYFTSMMDTYTFSWASIKSSGLSNLRFTTFINTGIHANVNLKKNTAFYTGLELRNLGYADVINNTKYRYSGTYLGVPLGVRIGDLKSKTNLIAGTGFDLPLYYKAKYWEIGNKRNKIKERTSPNNILRPFNPYLFVGYQMKGIGVKFQYYPQSFWANIQGKPTTNLMYLSAMLDIKGSNIGIKKQAKSE